MSYGTIGIYSMNVSSPTFLFQITFTFFMDVIENMCVLFSYVDNYEETLIVSFSTTNAKIKKPHHTKS
jgi:hypothetical protein